MKKTSLAMSATATKAFLSLLLVSCVATSTEIADKCAEWHDVVLPVTYFGTPLIEQGFGGDVQLARMSADDGTGSRLQLQVYFDDAQLHHDAYDAVGHRLGVSDWNDEPGCAFDNRFGTSTGIGGNDGERVAGGFDEHHGQGL